MVRPGPLRSDSETDDSLAAQAATAEVVQNLHGGGQFDGGTDTCGDRAVREHLCNRGQPLRRYQGILTGGMVVRGDLALSKPAFVRSEDGRDQMPSGPDDLASRRMASGPLTRSRTASTPSG